MSSLKRIMNPGFTDAEGLFYTEQVPQKQLYLGETAYSDVPSMAGQSWSDLINGILSTEFNSIDPQFQLESSLSYSPQNIELGIESWAEQGLLQQSEDQAPNHSSGSLNTRDENPSLDDSDLLCYGMIYKTAIRVVGNMLEVDNMLKKENHSSGSNISKFTLKKSKKQPDINFQDGSSFGVVNDHLSEALRGILDRPLIQLEPLGDIASIRDVIGKATKAKDPIVRININVYGPRQALREIGEHLSNHKVYLQPPDHQRLESIYENPHIVTFPDLQLSSLEQQLEVGRDIDVSPNSGETMQKTISKVYASLIRGTKLNRVEGDHRLETKLLDHQQEALDFMEQRESGDIPLEFCLWKPMDGENKGWFCHAITKAKSRIHVSENGGGILADEMGMGKTLSTLALITTTLESSYEWVKARNEDGSDLFPGKKKSCRATLVIVPSAILINEWFNEISMHLDGTLKTIPYHGPKRKTLIQAFEEVDIIITTYHTLVTDFKNKSSPLHKFEWFRIVLDEAHIIRRQTTTFYRAVFELKARSRWCLTGTPIQNRLEDIGALFAFIRVNPFHSMSTFRRYVTTPFEESTERREFATKNLTLLLESLCLRRSRDLLHLPDPQNITRDIDFSMEERTQYENTKKIMNRALRQRVGESFTKSTFGMFQIQLQLRILCNHGTYQHEFSWAKRSLLDEREDALCLVGGGGEVKCSACRESMPILGSNNVYRRYDGNCAHVLCSACLDENEQLTSENGEEASRCPLCAISGVPITMAGIGDANGMPNDFYLRQEGRSSKMEALIVDIQQDLWKTKSIVFSCWTNTLNLIEKYLRRESIPFHRIDGDCPLGRRQKILENFSSTDSQTPVLIMTTGTGAFGLNLTSANRVFIIEPQWNPSVENQAVSRAIRLRQKNSVIVTRYMVRGTVEQEMRSQQKKKLRLAGIGNSTSALG